MITVFSFVGGAAEAAFLVVVTRLLLAVSSSGSSIDLASATLSVNAALWVGAALLLLRVAAVISATRIAARATSEYLTELRRLVVSRYFSSSWTYRESEPVGKLQELLTTFAMQRADGLSFVITGLVSCVNLLALMAMALLVQPIAAIALLLATPLLGLLLRPLRRWVRSEARAAAATSMQFSTSVSDAVAAQADLNAYGVEVTMAEHLSTRADAAGQAVERTTFSKNLLPVFYTSIAFLALLLASLVASRVSTKDLSGLGAVMLLMLRSLSYGQTLQAMSAALSASAQYGDTLSSELDGLRQAAPLNQSAWPGGFEWLAARDVSVKLGGAPVLHAVSLEIRRGEAIGIVGPSGSGKTTLAQVLTGIREPDNGTIDTNHGALSGFDRSSLARSIAYVPQHARLIRGSAVENVKLLRPFDDESVNRALAMAHLSSGSIVAADQTDRELAGTVGLSGGQLQRLALARALVGEPELIVLDEPTSALDRTTEELIGETIRLLKAGGTTVVIVAHRLSTLSACNRVIVVDSGRIVDDLSYDDFLAREEAGGITRISILGEGDRK